MSEPLKTGTISYDISVSPTPLVINVGLSVVTSDVKVNIVDVPNLSVKLSPKYSWNPIDDLLTTVGLLANAFSSKISSAIVDKIKGVSIKVHTVQPVTVGQGGISLTFAPSDIKLSNDGKGNLQITADLSIS